MEDKRFWFQKPQNEKEISRNLEHNLYNNEYYHTVQQPQGTPYDPWADWFNAGLDPEPFTDNFAASPDPVGNLYYGEDPSYYPAEYGQNIPWEQEETVPWFQEEDEEPFLTEEQPESESEMEPWPEQEEEGGKNLFVSQPDVPDDVSDDVLADEERPLDEDFFAESEEEKRDLATDPALTATETEAPEEESVPEGSELEEENVVNEEMELEKESIPKEETGIEQESGRDQTVIVWRNFPAERV